MMYGKHMVTLAAVCAFSTAMTAAAYGATTTMNMETEAVKMMGKVKEALQQKRRPSCQRIFPEITAWKWETCLCQKAVMLQTARRYLQQRQNRLRSM